MAERAILDRVRVDLTHDVPVYVQIRDGLRREINAGRLLAGERLPTVQAFAECYGISTKTVMQAFNELSADGTIITRRGKRSCVGERRAPSTEVVLFVNPQLLAEKRQALFFQQIVEGLKDGFDNPDRRFWTTILADPQHTSVGEMLAVCAARRSDGLVAYRPRPEAADLMRNLATRIPVCTLFEPVGGAADCVLVDPAEPLRHWLLERVAEGKRRFAFIGITDADYERQSGCSPYTSLHREAIRVLEGAGIRCLEDIRSLAHLQRENFAQAISSLPEGTVVIAGNPSLVAVSDPRKGPLDIISYREFSNILGRLDIITYTESRSTLDTFGDRMSILYAGLEMAGQAAARLLQTRAKDRTAAMRTVRVAPELVRRRPNPVS